LNDEKRAEKTTMKKILLWIGTPIAAIGIIILLGIMESLPRFIFSKIANLMGLNSSQLMGIVIVGIIIIAILSYPFSLLIEKIEDLRDKNRGQLK